MDTLTRDERGRYLPGISGNPKGRGRGRYSDAVNDLADAGVSAVLQHDLEALANESTSPKERREALDRLTRLGARRVTAGERVTIDEAGVAGIVAVITRHVSDPETLAAIAAELEAAT